MKKILKEVTWLVHETNEQAIKPTKEMQKGKPHLNPPTSVREVKTNVQRIAEMLPRLPEKADGLKIIEKENRREVNQQ